MNQSAETIPRDIQHANPSGKYCDALAKFIYGGGAFPSQGEMEFIAISILAAEYANISRVTNMQLCLVCADILKNIRPRPSNIRRKTHPRSSWTERMAFLLSSHFPKLAGGGGIDDGEWVFAMYVFYAPNI